MRSTRSWSSRIYLQWEAARTQAERALARAVEEDPLGEVAANRVLASIEARGPALDWTSAQQHLEKARKFAERRRRRRDVALNELCHAECLAAQSDASGALELARWASSALPLDHYADRAERLVATLERAGR